MFCLFLPVVATHLLLLNHVFTIFPHATSILAPYLMTFLSQFTFSNYVYCACYNMHARCTW